MNTPVPGASSHSYHLNRMAELLLSLLRTRDAWIVRRNHNDRVAKPQVHSRNCSLGYPFSTFVAHTARTLDVFGDGSMVRDHLSVDDPAKILIDLALNNPGFTVLNVGSETHHTISEILSVVQGVTGKVISTRQVKVPPDSSTLRQ